MKQMNNLSGITNIRNAFLFEAGIGILANAFLLLFHTLTFVHEHKSRPTDVVIGLLALTHVGMLTIMGVTATDVFMPLYTWDDFKCKAVIYLYRLLRGLSLCATCLLSVLQAVTLSPSSSCLAKFKHKSPHQSLGSLLLLWVFYMSFSAQFSVSSSTSHNFTSHNLTFAAESCVVLPTSHLLRQVFTILGILRDATFLGLMALSSVHMVLFLRRHWRASRHLHGPSASAKASAEQTATRTILLLLTLFMVTYCLDCVVSSSRTRWSTYPLFQFIQMMLSNSYASVSPWLFLCTEKRMTHLSRSVWRRMVKLS